MEITKGWTFRDMAYSLLELFLLCMWVTGCRCGLPCDARAATAPAGSKTPNCSVVQPCLTASAWTSPGSMQLLAPPWCLPTALRPGPALRVVPREDFGRVEKVCAEKGVLAQVSGAAGGQANFHPSRGHIVLPFSFCSPLPQVSPNFSVVTGISLVIFKCPSCTQVPLFSTSGPISYRTKH